MHYYYADSENRTVGPVSLSELQRLKNVGTIHDRTWVIEEGAAEWKPFYGLIGASGTPDEVARRGGKRIQETKCTCQACGHIWFYGKQEVLQQTSDALQNLSKAMLCCGGCLPAILMPTKTPIDPGKCPKCGSKASRKEQIVHDV